MRLYDAGYALVMAVLGWKRFYEVIFVLLLILCVFARKFTVEQEEKKLHHMDFVFCIAVTIAVSTFFALFPMKNITLFNDSSIFLYIGKRMHCGYVPYKDLFDHKGIILYFIEYLGLTLVPNKFVGVWLIEVLCAFATCVYLLKTGRLFTNDRMVLYLSVFAVLIVCGNHLYEGGNLSEEYALPWIAMAVYVFYKYFVRQTYRRRELVLIGGGFLIVLMLRANMTAVWITFLPIVFLSLVYRRKWRDMAECVVCFSAGALAVGLPVLFYCIATGSLNDMITYYWRFNLNYVNDGTTIAQVLLCGINFLKLLFPASAFFLIGMVLCRKNKVYWFNLLYGICSLGLAVMSGRPYAHYGMILLPSFIMVFVCVLGCFYHWVDQCRNIGSNKRIFGRKYVYLCIVFCDVCFLTLNCLSFMLRRPPEPDLAVSYLKDYTDREDDVLILGNHVNYYLEADRYTENKFFNQIPPINVSDALYEEFLCEYWNKPSDVILILGEKETQVKLDGNLGKVYRMLELECQKGMLNCEVYDGFYVYRRQEF